MHITLRQLEVFVTIAQAGTLTRAAEQLHLTRSAASMALAELEAQLNQPVFERNKQRLSINRFGEKLLPYADDLLRRHKDIQLLTDPSQQFTGQLRIGVSNTIGNYTLPHLLAAFRKKTNHHNQTVTMGNSTDIFKALDHFQLDVGLVESTPNQNTLHHEIWQSDHLQVVANKNHPLSQKKHASLAELSQHPWVVREPGSGVRSLFDQRIRNILKNCTIALEFSSSEALVQSVIAGIGLGYLSELSLKTPLKNKQLCILKTPIPTQRNLYLVWHKNKYIDPLLEHFIEYCRHYLISHNVK